MWPWLVCSYMTLLLVLIGCAGLTTLFVGDNKRRRQAFRVLRLLLATLTSIIAATTFHLYRTGFFG